MQETHITGVEDVKVCLASPGTVLLDDQLDERSPAILYSQPDHILRCDRPDQVRQILEELDRHIEDGYYAAGYVCYEAGYAFEEKTFPELLERNYTLELDYPLIWMGLYSGRQLIQSEVLQAALPDPAPPTSLTPEFAASAYQRRIQHIRQLIEAGDLYQLNFTQRLGTETLACAESLYALLRQRQPVGYSAFIRTEDIEILSASPELFFSRSADHITCKPMKGTLYRGCNACVDKFLQQHLALDPKNRAENLMIVDLIRNDLARICDDVETANLFQVECYKSLLQMTSRIEGRLSQRGNNTDLGYCDIFPALFPCGSITGAPKVATMKNICHQELSPRGIYCGAIGHITPSREATFSVAIRTLLRKGNEILLGSGGGIVWDSHPEEEYEECLLKTRFLTSPNGENSPAPGDTRILETMRWQDGIELLEQHLARLTRTARHLNYRYREDQIRRNIAELAQHCVSGRTYRLRLLLATDGSLESACDEIDLPEVKPVLRFTLAKSHTHSLDPFLGIKTTQRATYDKARRDELNGDVDELVFLNERNELTEGSTTNLFLHIGKQWLTPPLSAGVLPGIMRKEVLQSELKPVERTLYPADLKQADNILLTNALRGVRQGVFIPPEQLLSSVPER